MELLISTIIGVLIVEVYNWLPFLCDKLLEQAVRQVREKDRDRCREEWSAGLAQLPNTVYRVAHTISIVVGASRFREDSFEFEQFELSTDLREIAHLHAKFVTLLTDHKAELRASVHERIEQMDEIARNVRSIGVIGSAKGIDFGRFVALTENHCKSNVSTYREAIDLSITSIDRGIGRLSDARALIDRMTANLQALTSQGNTLALDERDAVLLQVESDLLAAKAIMSDQLWDDAAFAEVRRMFGVVLTSMTEYGAVVRKIKAVFEKTN